MTPLDASTPIAHLPADADSAVEDAGALWSLWPFTDGSLLVEERDPARPARARCAVLPADVAADLGTAREAVALVIAAADATAVIGRVAIALLHGVTLEAPCRGCMPGDEHSASVGPYRWGAGQDGFACVLEPDGVPVATWQDRPEGRPAPSRFDPYHGVAVWYRDEDRGPFAAAQAFVNAVGPVLAHRALEQAAARAAGAYSRIDVERGRLHGLLADRMAQQRGSGTPIAEIAAVMTPAWDRWRGPCQAAVPPGTFQHAPVAAPVAP